MAPARFTPLVIDEGVPARGLGRVGLAVPAGFAPSRVTNDVSMVQFFVAGALIQTVNLGLVVGLNLWAMSAIDGRLTLLSLSVAPLIVVIQLQASSVMPMWRRMQQKMASLSGVLQENIAAIKLVKAFTREEHEAERFNQVLSEVREMRLVTSKYM